jgi:acetyl/propionyl-CoA carboxylase alpha subunit
MEYEIRIEGAICSIQVEPLEDDLYQISLFDRNHMVNVFEVSENLYSIICDGQAYEVDIMEEGDIYEIFIKGGSYWTEILRPDKMQPLLTQGEQPAILKKEVVTSPLTCKVIKILVEKGETVEVDQVLLIVEAMKMEMPISSPIVGKVKEVQVKEGQDVDTGTNLLTLTPL